MSTGKKKFNISKFITVFVFGVAAMLAFSVFQFWYQFVENGDSPYDEIFIEINGYMPQAARDWACGRIADRFPGTLPPYTCDKPN